MPFSPQEIENKEFVVSFRGYNRDEVRAFLRAAAADYRAALEGDTPAQGGELESRTASFTGLVSVAEDLRRSTVLARRRAEDEAADIRAEAEREARRTIEEAEREANEIKQTLERTTGDRLAEIARRTTELQTLEQRMARRLYFLETALELARRDLGLDPSSSDALRDDADELPVSAKRYIQPSFPDGD